MLFHSSFFCYFRVLRCSSRCLLSSLLVLQTSGPLLESHFRLGDCTTLWTLRTTSGCPVFLSHSFTFCRRCWHGRYSEAPVPQLLLVVTVELLLSLQFTWSNESEEEEAVWKCKGALYRNDPIYDLYTRVVTRTFSDRRTDGRSDDGRGGVRDLDAL
jgi:hypothetical protein